VLAVHESVAEFNDSTRNDSSVLFVSSTFDSAENEEAARLFSKSPMLVGPLLEIVAS
jgi:hypothetical protein